MAAAFTGCAPCTECDYCVHPVDEFVMDSYKIRQGKLAVQEMQGVCIDPMPNDAMCSYHDFIREDDVLNIAVYHPSRQDLSKTVEMINKQVGFRVHQGVIDLPDIEEVHVEGMSLEEARREINQRYNEQVAGIEVFISFRDRLRHCVELIGAVSTSHVPITGDTRLYDVLARARLTSCANLFKSYVIRDCERLPVDLYQLLHEGDMCQNIVMKGGDRIFIADAKDSLVMVMGEVGHAKAIPLPYGHISLREALVTAGGIPYTGNRECIQVIRGGVVCPKIYLLKWCHITQLPNESLLLIPGDTVYVTEKPITKWNRWISQLLPSMSCFQSGHGCYRVLCN